MPAVYYLFNLNVTKGSRWRQRSFLVEITFTLKISQKLFDQSISILADDVPLAQERYNPIGSPAKQVGKGKYNKGKI